MSTKIFSSNGWVVINIYVLGIVFFCLFINMSCEEDCIEDVKNYSAGGLLFDNISGAYPCSANFQQTITSYIGTDCRKTTSGNVSLEFVSNLSNQKVSFNYQVQFQRNLVSWSYSGSVNELKPGEKLRVGIIANNATVISNQYLLVTFTSPPTYN